MWYFDINLEIGIKDKCDDGTLTSLTDRDLADKRDPGTLTSLTDRYS